MDLKTLGRTGIKVPAIGLGTWEMGGGSSVDRSHDEEAIRAIRKAVDLGMYLIDTAERYAAGHCEELVGEAIKPFRRNDLFIVSKVWLTHLRYDDVLKSAEGSLTRLNTDWLDLYLVHFPNPEVPLSETMRAMEKLVERKLVRFIGVSNFGVSQIREAESYLSGTGLAANQVDYSLLVRGRERDVLPYCQERQISVMAFKPLARPSGDNGLPYDKFLRDIGERYHKTAAQVALNWLIRRGPVIAIPKAANLSHLEENAGAMGGGCPRKTQRPYPPASAAAWRNTG